MGGFPHYNGFLFTRDIQFELNPQYNDYNDYNDYNNYNDYRDSYLDLDWNWEQFSDSVT